MASPAQPVPPGAGDPNAGSPNPAGGPPSAAPANPKQLLIAQMYQACKRLAMEDPILSAGLSKAAEGLQEAQTAMVSQPAPQPVGSTPPY